MLKKLKSLILDDTVYIALLLVITAIGSFGLGRMTTGVRIDQTFPPAITMKEVVTTTTKAVTATGTDKVVSVVSAPVGPTVAQVLETAASPQQNFVASKAGTKYHALSCPGAKTIKESNKIYFTTIAEAEAAGYSRAANCPLR